MTKFIIEGIPFVPEEPREQAGCLGGIGGIVVIIIVILWFIFHDSKDSNHNQTQNTKDTISYAIQDTLKSKIDTNKSKKDTITIKSVSVAKPETKTTQITPKECIGKWVGSIGGFEFLLVIEEITPNSLVKGYYLMNEDKRILSGTLSHGNNFELSETGDEKQDDKFTFSIENSQINGIWISNNGQLARKYTLTKQPE